MKSLTLKQFLKDRDFRRNAYVAFPGFRFLYVRNTKRHLDGELRYPVLDLANAEALVPGSGAFTKLITHLRRNYPDLWLYAESVLNPRLEAKLPKLGFIRANDGASACFYLPPKEKK